MWVIIKYVKSEWVKWRASLHPHAFHHTSYKWFPNLLFYSSFASWSEYLVYNESIENFTGFWRKTGYPINSKQTIFWMPDKTADSVQPLSLMQCSCQSSNGFQGRDINKRRKIFIKIDNFFLVKICKRLNFLRTFIFIASSVILWLPNYNAFSYVLISKCHFKIR